MIPVGIGFVGRDGVVEVSVRMIEIKNYVVLPRIQQRAGTNEFSMQVICLSCDIKYDDIIKR